jgi:hypothetical protein
MIEDLFKRPTVLARYREGPLADAREAFLKHCEKQGYSRSMLRKIAWILLTVAHDIDIEHGNMSAQDIERAVDNRVRLSRQPNGLLAQLVAEILCGACYPPRPRVRERRRPQATYF